jgi:gas vesicle protein
MSESDGITNKIVGAAETVTDTVAATTSAVKEVVAPTTLSGMAGNYIAKKAITSKASLQGAGIGGIVGAILGGAAGFLIIKYRRKAAKEKNYYKAPGAKATEETKEVVADAGIHIGTSLSVAVLCAAIGSAIGIYLTYGRPLLAGYQAVSDTVETVKDVADVVTDTVDAAKEIVA